MNRLYFSDSLYNQEVYIRDVPIKIKPDDKIIISYPNNTSEIIKLYESKQEISDGKFTTPIYNYKAEIFHNYIKLTVDVSYLLKNGCILYIDREPTKEEIQDKINTIKLELKQNRIYEYINTLSFEERLLYESRSFRLEFENVFKKAFERAISEEKEELLK